MTAVAGVCVWQARNFFLDASADSLILEHDPQLRLFREISARYQSPALLAVTYTPHSGDVFDEDNLTRLTRLRDEIRALPDVQSVFSLLDAPLFRNPPVPLSRVTENVRTLEEPGVDRLLARDEIVHSEIYRQQLISTNGQTAVLAITMKEFGWADAAEAELQKAIELKPDYGIAHFNLALMLLERRPPAVELARRHYDKALALGVAKDEVVENRLKE
jgi:tetratricopeptide (TPR) repeat protein